MVNAHYGINVLLYGDAKTGKSFLGSTTPAPRLILDAEGGSRFTPGRKVHWNPSTEQPPESDGTWDTCLVAVRDFGTVEKAYQWLNSGQHPFRSVVLDSISEIQQRVVDAIAGKQQMTQQQWGELLRGVSQLIRDFRDLTTHPVKPLDAVIYIAMMAKDKDDGHFYPYMQGQIATRFPYYPDGCFYLTAVTLEDGRVIRRLYTQRIEGHPTVGERMGGALPAWIDDPNFAEMQQLVIASMNNGDITDTVSDIISTETPR